MSTAMKTYEYAMQLAYKMASDSPDPSTQNGSVLLTGILPGLPIIGYGVNNFPVGVDASHWNGPKEGKYARVVHAEVSAILDAAKEGFRTQDSILVCPWAACSNCSKHISEAGVAKLVRHKFANNGVTTGNHWYDDCLIGDEIMQQAGVEIIEIDPIPTDIQLRRDGKLWTPGG